MTGVSRLPELTKSELAILRVLWRRGEASAREVHEGLPETLGWAYSTTSVNGLDPAL